MNPFSTVTLYDIKAQKEDVFPRVTRPLRKKMDLTANPVMKSFLVGSFSGTCSTILFQPLDLVKTRLQQTVVLRTTPNSVAPFNQHSTSMFSVMRQVVLNEHFTALWRGITPSITRTVPGVGIYFGSVHWLKSHVLDSNSSPSALEAAAIGVAARTFAGTVMIPITVIKTRYESGSFNYTRMSTALNDIYKVEGARGLCRGLIPTLFRDAPYSGLYLMFYTTAKSRLASICNPDVEGHKLNWWQTSCCGIAAGIAASAVTHPADVVKTKMQVNPQVYSSIRVACGLIMKDQGLRGFAVGLAPRMLRRTLMSALAWTVYEEAMRRLGLK